MANPVLIDVPKNQWTLVASSVTRGQVSITGNSPPQFLSTYRIAGDPAPTVLEEGIRVSRRSVQIESRDPIDAYVYPQEKNGTVRVDI